MNISKELRNKLIKEIRYAVDEMKKSERLSDKIYFFSAVYGVIDRAYNFEYDPELVFIYQVVRQAFDNINAKVNLMTQNGASVGTSLPPIVFPKIEELLSELTNKLEINTVTHSVLEKIANIGYIATGNGSYLFYKGTIKE